MSAFPLEQTNTLNQSLSFRQRILLCDYDEKEKNMQTAKQAAKQIIDHVSDQATWDDIMYELYVKQKMEKGLRAVDEGRVISNEDAKKRLLGNEG